jgi:hypothetical protein
LGISVGCWMSRDGIEYIRLGSKGMGVAAYAGRSDGRCGLHVWQYVLNMSGRLEVGVWHWDGRICGALGSLSRLTPQVSWE